MASQQQSRPQQRPAPPEPSSRTSRGSLRSSRPSSGYTNPVGVGKQSGGNIGALEAEYFGSLILIFLTVFTDSQSSYSAKMLAVMKRGTLASVLFFILALMSAGSDNMGRFAKAIGALVVAGIFLGTAGQGTISAMDTFFKADWTSGDTTEGDAASQAPAGQQHPGLFPSKDLINADIQAIQATGGNTITNIPSGLKDALDKINQALRNLL